MATIHGVRSFAGVRDRAMKLEIGGAPLLVASLDDIIKEARGQAAARLPSSRHWRLHAGTARRQAARLKFAARARN